MLVPQNGWPEAVSVVHRTQLWDSSACTLIRDVQPGPGFSLKQVRADGC